MKKTLVIGLAVLCAGSVARSQDFSISSDLTFASEYIFRGIKLAENSLQPSIEFAADEFYAGLWTNLPLENRSSANLEDELDFYLGFTPKLSDAVTLDIGATHYYFTGASGRPTTDSTTEAFIGANFLFENFSPGVYAYYDFDLEAFTIQGNLGFSIPLDQVGTSLDLAFNVGHVNPDEGESYLYYGAGLSVPYKINENATVKVGVNWASHDLNDQLIEDDHLWFTAGVTVGF